MLQVKRFFRQCRNKLNKFNLFRLCWKDEISFDIVAEIGIIVAQNGNTVEATVDFVERKKFYNRIDRHCCRLWQQSRMLLRQSWTFLRQCCLLLRHSCCCGPGLRCAKTAERLTVLSCSEAPCDKLPTAEDMFHALSPSRRRTASPVASPLADDTWPVDLSAASVPGPATWCLRSGDLP